MVVKPWWWWACCRFVVRDATAPKAHGTVKKVDFGGYL
jgi:hypothetical protein